MRYRCMVQLPDVLQHRPIEHWEERPDLVSQLKSWVDDMELWCWEHSDCNFVICLDKITLTHMEFQFELEMDAVRFAQQHHADVSDITYIQMPEYSVSWSN